MGNAFVPHPVLGLGLGCCFLQMSVLPLQSLPGTWTGWWWWGNKSCLVTPSSSTSPALCVAVLPATAPTAHRQQNILTASLVEFPTRSWVLLVLQELFLNLACLNFLLFPCNRSMLWYRQNIFSKEVACCCDQNWLLVSSLVHRLFLFVKCLGPWANILFWVPKVYHSELILALWSVDTVELEIAMESELAFRYCVIAWALVWRHASNVSARSN